MTSRLRLASMLLCIAAIAACAKTEVTARDQLYSGKLPRPAHIWVYDFVSDPSGIPPESALASATPDVAAAPQSAEQTALAHEIGADIANELVAQIEVMGLPAERATPESALGVNDIVLRGYLISVVAGSAVERVAIGLGKGDAELKTAVEGFQVTEGGLRKLGSGSIDSGDSKTPGAAVPLVVAIATKNPLGLIVSTGVKLHDEKTGSATIQGKAKETAQEIATAIKPKFQEQGWIP